MEAIRVMQPPKNAKQVQAFIGLMGYYWKFIENFAYIAKLLTTLMHHNAKFDWTLSLQAAFITLKEALIQPPTVHYQNPSKLCIVYIDVLDNTCRAQLSQEHSGQELPVTFILPTFMDTQCKWSTPKQEAYGIYYTITKWNYYLQGSNIVVHNDHKPL